MGVLAAKQDKIVMPRVKASVWGHPEDWSSAKVEIDSGGTPKAIGPPRQVCHTSMEGNFQGKILTYSV